MSLSWRCFYQLGLCHESNFLGQAALHPSKKKDIIMDGSNVFFFSKKNQDDQVVHYLQLDFVVMIFGLILLVEDIRLTTSNVKKKTS